MFLIRFLFGFHGRINRLQYWGGTFLVGAVSGVGLFLTVGSALFSAGVDDKLAATQSAGLLMIPVQIVTTWMSLALQTKRFHDRGRTGDEQHRRTGEPRDADRLVLHTARLDLPCLVEHELQRGDETERRPREAGEPDNRCRLAAVLRGIDGVVEPLALEVEQDQAGDHRDDRHNDQHDGVGQRGPEAGQRRADAGPRPPACQWPSARRAALSTTRSERNSAAVEIATATRVRRSAPISPPGTCVIRRVATWADLFS